MVQIITNKVGIMQLMGEKLSNTAVKLLEQFNNNLHTNNCTLIKASSKRCLPQVQTTVNDNSCLLI